MPRARRVRDRIPSSACRGCEPSSKCCIYCCGMFSTPVLQFTRDPACSPEYKRSRHEIKKKSSDTMKLQKKARKGEIWIGGGSLEVANHVGVKGNVALWNYGFHFSLALFLS